MGIVIRIGHVLREITRGGLAGVVGGLIVGGIGGRIVMRIAALANPDATGLRTENGEIVGAITANGTLALILFGGLAAGLVAGVVWVVIRPWIPGSGLRRVVVTMPIAVALGGPVLVKASNPDFVILGPDGPLVAMLIGLVGVAGAAVATLDGWLDRRLPLPEAHPIRSIVVYGIVAGLGGLLAVPITLATYFQSNLRPEAFALMGLAVVAAGVATLLSWIGRITSGEVEAMPAPVLPIVGRLGLLVAVAIGGWILLADTSAILAAE
ncbi:MAG: hypothetical protein AABZ33_08715 [Chloroflexota bacterium]